MASSIQRKHYDAAKRFLGFWWSVLVLVAALIAGVAQGAKGITWERQTLGERYPTALLVITLFALGVATLEGVFQVVRRYQWHLRGVRNDPLVGVAHTLVRGVNKITGIPVEDIGVSIFVVRRDWWAFSRRQSLFRVHKFRITGSSASDVDWTKGKGAVGRAWAEKRVVHQDWTDIRARCPENLTESRFARMRPQDKGEFTLHEFEQLRDKYSEVLAVPAKEELSPVLRAIVSIDTARSSRSETEAPKLFVPDVVDALEEAARRVVSTGTR